VIAAVVLVKTFAEDSAVFNEDAADSGVGAGEADALAREVQGVLHKVKIVRVRHWLPIETNLHKRMASKRDSSTAGRGRHASLCSE
jgi:hypothetical protein